MPAFAKSPSKRRPMRKLIVLRRFSQIAFLSLFIYILWSTTYPLKGLISPKLIFKIDPLTVFITALSERVMLPGILLSGVMILLSLILGRFFCGWVCPLGSCIDGAATFKKSGLALPPGLRFIKFALFGLLIILAIFGIQAAWTLDPVVIAARFVSLNLIPAVTTTLDQIFVFFIRQFELYRSPVYDFYRDLKAGFLGVEVDTFQSSLPIFLMFAVIVAASLLRHRFWCRVLCPLGALYAAISGKSLLRRTVGHCVSCQKCVTRCRTGAILPDSGYHQGECILCMDCVYTCPVGETAFTFPNTAKASKPEPSGSSVTRKEFLLLLAAGLTAPGWSALNLRNKPFIARDVIRPPGALDTGKFADRCIRCGNCMKVCVTNGLQPALLEGGWDAVWTPRLISEIGYCEFNCTLCGEVCPTGAIQSLSREDKQKFVIGLAEIDKEICLPWKEGKECIVCEEHCPVADKAIKLEKDNADSAALGKPYVIEDLCIGCGICEHVCPTRPERAIRVFNSKKSKT